MTANRRYRAICRDSLKTALLVGTALNLVNHGEAILASNGIAWTHVALNYCVPFCVSGYSAYKSSGS